ncbi:MAG: M12 family metallopeptidase [Thermoanaerobaculia bacterium]
MPELHDLCFDEYLEGDQFDPAQVPSRIDLTRASSAELAMFWSKQWQSGQELRIMFLDGEPELHARIEQHARQWLEHANVAFTFGKFANAEIRISFKGIGYWSLCGTDAMGRAAPLPTMQFGGFSPGTDDTLVRRTVLHEFGHALGCIHEQASPAIDIPWDEEKVYAFYKRTQNWDEEKTYNNVLRRYSAAETKFTEYDSTSIMQYPVSKELTRGGFEIAWNTQLSAMDRSFIARMYP